MLLNFQNSKMNRKFPTLIKLKMPFTENKKKKRQGSGRHGSGNRFHIITVFLQWELRKCSNSLELSRDRFVAPNINPECIFICPYSYKNKGVYALILDNFGFLKF